MKFYLASGLGNIDEARRLIALLKSLGHECSYDWTKHGSVWRHGVDVLAQVTHNELAGVMHTDVVIARLPGGRGMHFEAGAAAGALHVSTHFIPIVGHRPRPTVIWYGAPSDFEIGPNVCAFYYYPLVMRVTSDDELLAALRRIEE